MKNGEPIIRQGDGDTLDIPVDPFMIYEEIRS